MSSSQNFCTPIKRTNTELTCFALITQLLDDYSERQHPNCNNEFILQYSSDF